MSVAFREAFEKFKPEAERLIRGLSESPPTPCSASDMTECVGCRTPFPAMRLYYVGGENENEPLCAACVVDALLSLRTNMQNAQGHVRPCSEAKGA